MGIEELIAEFIERREDGEEISPASFAGEYPQAGPELVKRLAALACAEALFPEEPTLDVFGPYRVVRELGRGGMGVVHEAVHHETGTRVALKVLNLAGQSNRQLCARFAREGAVLRALSHPNIVGIEDVGSDGDIPWIAMELVDGRSLAVLVRDAVLRREMGGRDGLALPAAESGWRGAVVLVERLARAVAAAHAAGVLHRDLKPGNVIVRPDGRPVLLDFGLVGHEDSLTLTRTGELVGTPQYMAPEQARGEKTDARSDVYALGVLLFELLTLRTPHEGDDRMRVLEAVWSVPAPELRQVAPEVPAAVAAIVDRSLAFEPKGRYPDAERLADDLVRVLDGRDPTGGRGRLGRFLGR